jgi:hypothetical protein
MFSYADLRRLEIALAVEEWYPAWIPDDVICAWQTIRDVARDVVAYSESPLIEAEVLVRVRQLIAEGWDFPLEDVAPDAELFGERLKLDCHPFMRPTSGPP